MTQEATSRPLEDRLLVIETRLEYLATKSDLETAVHALTWRLLGIVGVAIVIVGLLDKFVRP